MSIFESNKTRFINTGRASGFALALAGAAFTVAALGSTPASARIKCHNGFQIVNGNRLATPYCQDKLLASVAREYGTRVSARSIRNNPNLKRNVCRLVGRDIRVQENCLTVSPHPRGRF